jgi:outer membrane protein assembly factor BamB
MKTRHRSAMKHRRVGLWAPIADRWAKANPNLASCALICMFLCGVSVATAQTQDPAQTARQILQATGVKGGLIVQIGCGRADTLGLTAALRANDAYLVQGLSRSVRDLAEARKSIRSKGLYGPVSADLLEGQTLPYIDNSVNLIVSDGPPGVSQQEIMRVLAPRGVAYIRQDGNWTKTVKPWPANIDEWTHYLHDPTNNAVAHDTAIGPLRHLQWDAPPQYSRHHEYTTSVAAVVSAHGRVFSIMDMGSRASIQMPSKWRLIARDAFNGILLWERPIDSWFNHLWPLKDGPAQPPRRLVAVGDSVYVTLGLDAPVSRLDAATGRTLHTYEGTQFTEEILCSNGTLFLLKNNKSMNPKSYYPKMVVCWDDKNDTMKESEGYLLKPDNRDIIALDAQSGQILWNVKHPVEPLTLAVDDQSVYFHDWNRVVCLDRQTGAQRWRSEIIDRRSNMGYVNGPTLVVYKDVVLFVDGRLKRTITALSKKDGTQLWQAPFYSSGHAGSPEDLLVVDGLVWCGKIAGGNQSGVFTGRDPETGQVKREFTPDIKTYWFHHRCYRSKATDRYILTSRTGIEFVDVRNETWEAHHWTRGACSYGIMPCNGLIYAPPSPCACYLESRVTGFSALAPDSERAVNMVAPAEDRLVKGPAYGLKLKPQNDETRQWPTYRHDAARSGVSTTCVGLPLAEQWHTQLAGGLTSPVIAGGRVYTASKNTDTLYALDIEHGRTAWTFTTGADVDSPPTVYRGLVIFGSADGRVYCLRASDGALVWRFRAAPRDMRLVSYGRLESVWPVHGNVLVRDGIVYCVAGRSTFLDGGLRFFRLDAATGRMLTEKVLNDQHNPQKDVNVLNMPTALPDILSCDGTSIYMRGQAFDLKGQRVQTVDPATKPFERAAEQLGPGEHLFCPSGFLDGNAWHRSYWLYGRAFSSGCDWWYRAGRYAPAGRLLVIDGDRVYGFGRKPYLFTWSHVLKNRLFCSARQADPNAIERVEAWSKKAARNTMFNRQFMRSTPARDRLAPQQYWSDEDPPLHARAMVLAGRTLFVAGSPNVLNEDDAFKRPDDPKVQAEIAEQDAAYDGRKGTLLLAVSAGDGKELSRLELPSVPVWDGMAAAEGRLFLCDQQGRLRCFAGK